MLRQAIGAREQQLITAGLLAKDLRSSGQLLQRALPAGLSPITHVAPTVMPALRRSFGYQPPNTGLVRLSMQLRYPGPLTYRPEIDGLRAIAVLPVVLFHGGVPLFENGNLGVDIFFVISGYLIASLLFADRPQGRLRLQDFYERRVRRIAPALVVVTLVTAVAGFFILTPTRMIELAQSIIAAFTLSANFWFMSQATYFATPTTLQPLIHLWTLAVEEQFYLLFPILILLTRTVRPSLMFWGLLLCCAVSIAISQFVAAADANQAFFRPDTRAWQLILGALCSLIPRRSVPAKEFVSIAGVALLAGAFFVLPRPVAPTLLALPCAFGTALVIVGASRDTVVGRCLSLRPVVFVGLVSYSFYLWHQPLLALARIYKSVPLAMPETLLLILTAFALSALTWSFVERPARDRRLMSFRPVLGLATTGAAVAVMFAVGAIASSGYAFRYGDKADAYFAAVDLLDASTAARTTAIRMGICHFRVDRSPPLKEFLRDWSCPGDSTGNGVLVVGDSHAADIAAGFRLNGMEVAQMTGAGCGLSPNFMSDDCREMFDFISSRSEQKAHFRYLVVANDQTQKKYTAEDVDASLAYWGKLDIPIFWLSDMPQFEALEDRKASNLLDYGDAMSGPYPLSLKEAEANYRWLLEAAAGRFAVMNSADIYCSFASHEGVCLPFQKAAGWLASSSGHLTALGARLFIAAWLADRGNQQPFAPLLPAER